MRLNAAILSTELSKKYAIKYYGPTETSLYLKRPILYDTHSDDIIPEKNRVYCFNEATIHFALQLGADSLIVYVGPELTKQRKPGRQPYIWLKGSSDQIIEVFNHIQHIFDQYDDWGEKLHNILTSTVSIQEMIDCSESILGNPITVINGALHFLGYSKVIDADPQLALYRPGSDGKIPLEYMHLYLTFRDQHTKDGPVFFKKQDGTEVFVWDIWQKERFLGTMNVPFSQKPRQKSDYWILQILGNYIQNALTHYNNNPRIQSNGLRSAFFNLIKGNALDAGAHSLLQDSDGETICIKMKFLIHTEHSQPISFYCSYAETVIPKCVCFEHEASMVAFVKAPEVTKRNIFKNSLLAIMKELNLIVGISNSFSNLMDAPYYYQQASQALKLGTGSGHSLQQSDIRQNSHKSGSQDSIRRKLSERTIDDGIFCFGDYQLDYMLSKLSSEMPIETLYTTDVKRLLEHDATSKVSYLHTLRTYLNNSMNITKTALDLQIHRSSFLERLKNIESMIEIRLDEPEQRLVLELLLEEMSRR